MLSVAQVHEVQLDEIERRRTLIMGIMLGESGSKSIGKLAEHTGQHWARQLISKVPAATLRQINVVLGKNLITKYGTKQGIIVLGRVVPLGIDAVIGGGANATVAALAARRAFGPGTAVLARDRAGAHAGIPRDTVGSRAGDRAGSRTEVTSGIKATNRLRPIQTDRLNTQPVPPTTADSASPRQQARFSASTVSGPRGTPHWCCRTGE